MNTQSHITSNSEVENIARFEVGRIYTYSLDNRHSIMIEKRTEKTITGYTMFNGVQDEYFCNFTRKKVKTQYGREVVEIGMYLFESGKLVSPLNDNTQSAINSQQLENRGKLDQECENDDFNTSDIPDEQQGSELVPIPCKLRGDFYILEIDSKQVQELAEKLNYEPVLVHGCNQIGYPAHAIGRYILTYREIGYKLVFIDDLIAIPVIGNDDLLSFNTDCSGIATYLNADYTDNRVIFNRENFSHYKKILDDVGFNLMLATEKTDLSEEDQETTAVITELPQLSSQIEYETVKIGSRQVAINKEIHSQLFLDHNPVFAWCILGNDGKELREPFNPDNKTQPVIRFKKQETAENFAKKLLSKIQKMTVNADKQDQAIVTTGTKETELSPDTEKQANKAYKQLLKGDVLVFDTKDGGTIRYSYNKRKDFTRQHIVVLDSLKGESKMFMTQDKLKDQIYSLYSESFQSQVGIANPRLEENKDLCDEDEKKSNDQRSLPTTSIERLNNNIEAIKKSRSSAKPKNAFIAHSPGNYDGGGSQFNITFDRDFTKDNRLKSAIENITGYGYLHQQNPNYSVDGDTVVISWRNPDTQSSRISENIKMISDRLEKAGIKTPKSERSLLTASTSKSEIKSYEDAAKTPKGGASQGDADNMRATYAQGLASLGGGLPDNPKMIYDWSIRHNVDLNDVIAKHGKQLTKKAIENGSSESLALMDALYNDKPLNISESISNPTKKITTLKSLQSEAQSYGVTVEKTRGSYYLTVDDKPLFNLNRSAGNLAIAVEYLSDYKLLKDHGINPQEYSQSDVQDLLDKITLKDWGMWEAPADKDFNNGFYTKNHYLADELPGIIRASKALKNGDYDNLSPQDLLALSKRSNQLKNEVAEPFVDNTIFLDQQKLDDIVRKYLPERYDSKEWQDDKTYSSKVFGETSNDRMKTYETIAAKIYIDKLKNQGKEESKKDLPTTENYQENTPVITASVENKNTKESDQSTSFKIRVLKNQIAACEREIKRGIKFYIDSLVVLEGKLETLLTQTQEKIEEGIKFIELRSYRRAGVNAYLVEEGKDHTHNMYGIPINEENQQRAYRSKSHTVKVRIDNLPDGIYRFVEAGGSTGKKVVKGWLKIVGGEIIEESSDLSSLIVGEDANNLPELQGSQKQIDWAFQIRKNAIAKFKKANKEIPVILTQSIDARWFIENRSSL